MNSLPPGFNQMRERYLSDPVFAQAVNVMRTMLDGGLLTTLDLRNAALVASLIWEERNVSPIVISRTTSG